MQSTLKNRTIFCRDNLDVLQGINNDTIDLVYLDPPFNKKKIFTAPIGSSAEGAGFSDIFREEDVKEEWLLTIQEDSEKLHNFLTGIKQIDGRASYNFCYLAYLSIRLLECHRVLKETGSLYLHCDPTMSHYLKIVLDCIFGESNFRNEIVWQRNDSRGKGSQYKSKKFGANTDSILFYTKTDLSCFYLYEDVSDEEIYQKFPKVDEKGRRYNTGTPIFRSKSMGARPNLCYEWRGFQNPYPAGWRLSKERLEEECQKGNIIIKSDGSLERRKYLADYQGVPIDNNWTDIHRVSTHSQERTGYPTQKPLALLERIIKASTNKGDVVLDPFCGCATTCVASEKLGRQWIGIDVSVRAYELVKKRLQREVANPSNLLQYKNEIHFSNQAPKRTDIGETYQLKKWVYIISNQSYEGEYKVGIANDWQKRLNSYQTSDPNRDYRIEYKVLTPRFRELEKHIHTVLDSRHEWVRANLKAIIKAIDNFETCG